MENSKEIIDISKKYTVPMFKTWSPKLKEMFDHMVEEKNGEPEDWSLLETCVPIFASVLLFKYSQKKNVDLEDRQNIAAALYISLSYSDFNMDYFPSQKWRKWAYRKQNGVYSKSAFSSKIFDMSSNVNWNLSNIHKITVSINKKCGEGEASPKKCPPGREWNKKKRKCYKICKEYQYRHPETNRCRNKEGHKKTKKMKECKEHQYRHPKTNRCRNKVGYKSKPKPKNKETDPKTTEKPKDISDDSRNCIERSSLELRPLQKKVVKHMENNDSLLVVHGTGCGKTLTAVTVSQCYLDKYPQSKVVFVAPTSLIKNFQKEMERFGSIKNMEKYKYYSYAKFANVKNPECENSMLIMDEVHNLRTFKSIRSQAVQKCAMAAKKRLLLTATPFVNNLQDFVPLINILYGKQMLKSFPKVFDSKAKKKLKSYLRNKVDFVDCKDARFFPTEKAKFLRVPMSKKYYKEYKNQIDEDKSDLFSNPKTFYNGFRRAVNSLGGLYFSDKINKSVKIIKKGKSLVYSNWLKFGIKPITKALSKNKISYEAFTGSLSKKKRQEIINRFNNDEFQVLIITKAGGEGLDLKGVRNVIVMDPPWNYATLSQIVGRAARYNSHSHLSPSKRSVKVYYMLLTAPDEDKYTKESISGDVVLYNLIRQKKNLNKNVEKLMKNISI